MGNLITCSGTIKKEIKFNKKYYEEILLITHCTYLHRIGS